LVVLEVPDDLVGISLAPVARFACSVGDAAQGATVVVRACAGGLADFLFTDLELGMFDTVSHAKEAIEFYSPEVFM
jgi:hypothetical protein